MSAEIDVFNPMTECKANSSTDQECVLNGVYIGENPEDAALAGRYNTETGESISKCIGAGVCELCPTRFEWVID